jgi:hypothetical protein
MSLNPSRARRIVQPSSALLQAAARLLPRESGQSSVVLHGWHLNLSDIFYHVLLIQFKERAIEISIDMSPPRFGLSNEEVFLVRAIISDRTFFLFKGPQRCGRF